MTSSLFVEQHHIWVCYLRICIRIYVCSVLAPEILSGQPYNISVDWWSLGIVMYLLSVGKV